MNYLLVSLLLCLSLQSLANEETPTASSQDIKNTSQTKISGEVSILSNDIFRGVSISNNKSVVQGWLNLSYLDFLNLGVYTSETHFIVPSDPTQIANRYNVYYSNIYIPVYKDILINLQYFRYDFIEYSSLNQDEYFVEIIKKDSKLSFMHNPNYIGLDTKYNYISFEHKFSLENGYSISPLVSTTIVEKPENVDVRNYQEFRVTLTKDLKLFKINTVFSTTNRKHYYEDKRYKDTALAFGIYVPF